MTISIVGKHQLKTSAPDQLGAQTETNHQPAVGHRWLGPGLFVLSIAGLPLSGLILARLGRRGGVVLEAACTLLFARAIHFVVTGTPARLRTLPRLLAYTELAVDGMAAASGFWVWNLAAAHATSPGHLVGGVSEQARPRGHVHPAHRAHGDLHQSRTWPAGRCRKARAFTDVSAVEKMGQMSG